MLWNKVRTKSTPAEERGQLITKMVTKIQGHVLQITLRHDASRFVQSIIQFSTTEERKKILMELAPKLIEIAKTPYGHFTVLKAINFCTAHPEQRIIVKGLSGHFVSLGTNVIGARIVESIFKLFAPKVVRGLKAEFYGHVSKKNRFNS